MLGAARGSGRASVCGNGSNGNDALAASGAVCAHHAAAQRLRAYLDLGYGRGVLGSFFLGAHARTSAVATVALELALAPLLLVRRTRTAGVVFACAMHTIFELTVRPDVLGWVMVAMLLAFVEARPREPGGKAGP